MKKQSTLAAALICTIAACTESAEHFSTQKSESTAVIPVPVDSTKQKMPVIIPDTVKQENMPVVQPAPGVQPK